MSISIRDARNSPSDRRYIQEAFGEYLDHLSDTGVLTITRWVFDGLRLVSLAQEACDARGLDAARHRRN